MKLTNENLQFLQEMAENAERLKKVCDNTDLYAVCSLLMDSMFSLISVNYKGVDLMKGCFTSIFENKREDEIRDFFKRVFEMVENPNFDAKSVAFDIMAKKMNLK